MALTPQQQTALLQMTQAMFNATLGSVYFSALASQIEAGQSIAGLAQSLSGTALFLGKDYSTLTVPAEFAAALVDDLVGDDATAANKTVAINFIVDRMNAGANQDAIITEVTGILSTMPVSDPTWGKAALHFNTGNVGILVNNLLGEAVDADTKAAAVDLLLNRMASGDTFGTVVEWAYTTLDSVNYTTEVWTAPAMLFDNRIEVSDYYTLGKRGGATDVATLRQVLSGVTTDFASVLPAKQAIDALLGSNLPVIDLASLNGSNGFALVNDVQFENLASKEISSIGSAGDINGDGFEDVIVGTTAVVGNEERSKNFGSSFVVFGKAGGFAATQSLTGVDGNNGVRLNGLRTSLGDSLGVSVSSAGDINDDGIDDVVITAPFITDDGSSFSAATRVVFGKTSGWDAVIDLPGLNGTNGFSITSGSVGPVSNIGDFNGDGIDDLILGDGTSSMPAEPYAGSSYIVFGKAGGFSATVDVATLLDGSSGFRLDGVDFAASLGNSVGAGDINGDGLGDIIVAAPFTGQSEPDPTTGDVTTPGAAYVVFGKTGGVGATMTVDSLDGSNGFRLSGAGNDQVGSSYGNLGDFNGDGFDDIIINMNTRPDNAGRSITGSYVVFGKAAGFDANIDLHSPPNGSNGFLIKDGVANNVGDINKDGFDDLSVQTSSGAGYIMYGKNSGFAATIALDQLDAASAFLLKGSFNQVQAAGDINKDGFDDVMLIGATTDAAEAGQVYVVFGGVSI